MSSRGETGVSPSAVKKSEMCCSPRDNSRMNDRELHNRHRSIGLATGTNSAPPPPKVSSFEPSVLKGSYKLHEYVSWFLCSNASLQRLQNFSIASEHTRIDDT